MFKAKPEPTGLPSVEATITDCRWWLKTVARYRASGGPWTPELRERADAWLDHWLMLRQKEALAQIETSAA